MSDINLIADSSVGDVNVQITVEEPSAEINVQIEVPEPTVDVSLEGYGGSGDLPGVTAEDNGKVLTVVDGTWKPAEPHKGVDFTTDETLVLEDGVLRVNTTDAAMENDTRPITAQGVYSEFSIINALLKTI